MRLRSLDVLVAAYGLLVIALAVYAFVATHSKMSLMMGGSSGVLVLILLAVSFKSPRVGRIGTAVIALILGIFFIKECLKTGFAKVDFDVLALASIVVVVALGAGHMYAMKQKRLEGQ